MENFSSSTARYFWLKTALEKACGGEYCALETGTSNL
jgi:hypothetical protein